MGTGAKKVDTVYFDLIEKLGNELRILLHVPSVHVAGAGYPAIGEAIERVRSRNVSIEPGYDGEYGKIRL
jgi:PHP family Zn ribbon phosphoesterase